MASSCETVCEPCSRALLASANCDSTYYGELRGYFDIQCAAKIAEEHELTLDDDQSQENVVYRREAIEYVRSHLSRLPTVEAVRLLRIVGLYKTENGARVGDIFMSLIHTAELAKEDPFHYLTELLRHPEAIRRAPEDWMPWNYRETIARIADEASPRP